MRRAEPVRALFLDIGGVLLTNGWDKDSRQKAALKFNLDFSELERGHRSVSRAYELGKISLDNYLDRAVFNRRRSFSRKAFKDFMFAQSRPYPEMLRLMRGIKAKRKIKIAALSNEGRELNAYRIRRFGLDRLMDFFVSSCYVGLRKPDERIYRMALDVSQVPARQAVYVDDREDLARAGAALGLRAVRHSGLESTRDKLAGFGL